MNQRKPKRSNFDLISGMILGGLIVGVLLPYGTKFLSEDAGPKFSMKAKPLVASSTEKGVARDKSKAKERLKPAGERTLLSANAEPRLKTAEDKDAKKPLPPPKKEARNIEKSAPKKLEKETAKTDERREKERKNLLKEKKLSSSGAQRRVAKDPLYTENLEEVSGSTDAVAILQKTDESLVDTKLKGDSLPQTLQFQTISHAQYTKDQLEKCPKRCLLKSTDAQGRTVHAIIDGPAFADVLKDHEGTINLTGIKRTIKNQEVFMVQNITFNVVGKKAAHGSRTGQSSGPSALNTPPSSTISVKNAGAAAYEDLNEEIKMR